MTQMIERPGAEPAEPPVRAPRSRAAAMSTGVGILFWPGGMALAIVGLRHTRPGGKSGHGWAISGLVTSIFFGALSLLVVIAGVAASNTGAPTAAKAAARSRQAPAASASPIAARASSPAPVVRPSASAPTPAPVKAPAPAMAPRVDPVATTRAAILKAIGSTDSARPEPTVAVTGAPGETIAVTFPTVDNLTQGFIVTGMASTTTDVLQAVRQQATWDYGQVVVTSTFPMTDRLGRSTEGRIFSATYSKDIVDAIDFAGFSYRNVGAIGSDVYEDPTVAEKLD